MSDKFKVGTDVVGLDDAQARVEAAQDELDVAVRDAERMGRKVERSIGIVSDACTKATAILTAGLVTGASITAARDFMLAAAESLEKIGTNVK